MLMKKTTIKTAFIGAALAGSALFFAAKPVSPKKNKVVKVVDDSGLKLPTGFTALIVADNLGQARHIAVTSSGGKIFLFYC